ncbi:MAG: virulence protein RhuM/Fic/DOC family protein [Candidatus Saccharimonadales bacterium]
MNSTDNNQGNLVIYQGADGAIELPVDVTNETIWATQAQIVSLFGIDQSGVARHIKNILHDEEVDEKSNMQKTHIANSDKPVTLYSLDIILAVGYRANSGNAIRFRKWATTTLKQYITSGFVIDKERVQYNHTQFMRALTDMKLLAENTNQVGSAEATDLALQFASTWLSLDAYDKSELPASGKIKQQISVGSQDLQAELAKLKTQLIAAGEATDIFGTERAHGGLDSLFHNVFQSFAGEDIYPTIEEKAAHLLYFTVKNHVFLDGNKRSGAFAFVWFLREAGILNIHEISPPALTAITLLVAESQPSDKDKMVGLVLLMLGVRK